MASEEDITNKHTVFYIFDNTMTLSSVACLESDSFPILNDPGYIYYNCKSTVPPGSLYIGREHTQSEPFRRLVFDRNIYVYESQVKKLIEGRRYAIVPTSRSVGYIVSETYLQIGNAVGAEHCQTNYQDKVHEIFEIVEPVSGGRRKARKTYKKRKQQKKYTQHRSRK